MMMIMMRHDDRLYLGICERLEVRPFVHVSELSPHSANHRANLAHRTTTVHLLHLRPNLQQNNSRTYPVLCRKTHSGKELTKQNEYTKLEMWANAQRDGRPAEYRWRPLFNATKFGWRPLLECRAVTKPRRDTRWNMMGCPKPANRSQPLVGRSSPYCKDMWRRYCCLVFSDCRCMP